MHFTWTPLWQTTTNSPARCVKTMTNNHHHLWSIPATVKSSCLWNCVQPMPGITCGIKNTFYGFMFVGFYEDWDAKHNMRWLLNAWRGLMNTIEWRNLSSPKSTSLMMLDWFNPNLHVHVRVYNSPLSSIPPNRQWKNAAFECRYHLPRQEFETPCIDGAWSRHLCKKKDSLGKRYMPVWNYLNFVLCKIKNGGFCAQWLGRPPAIKMALN